MKISRREGLLLAVLAAILTATLGYMYGWQPLLAERATLRSETAALRQQLTSLQTWQGRDEELTARVAALTRQVSEETAARQRGVPLPDVLVLLEDAARATNVELAATTFTADGTAALATVQFFGSYGNLHRFLNRLEDQVGVWSFASLQLTAAADELRGTLRAHLFSNAVIGEPRTGGFPGRSPFAPRRP